MKTRLDLILDAVTEWHEVTVTIEGEISRDQVKAVEDAAEKRGLVAAFDGHHFLIRKIRKEVKNAN